MNTWIKVKTPEDIFTKTKLFVNKVEMEFKEIIDKTYKDFFFSTNLGISGTVEEELYWAIRSAAPENLTNVHEIIKQWDLEEYQKYDVNNLSGGWSKWLSIACFVETRHMDDALIFINVSHQLSQNRIARLLEILERKNTKVYFLEYDSPPENSNLLNCVEWER